jgi:predicted dehydrogenase
MSSMKQNILLIGSGAYGSYIEKAVQDMAVIKAVDGLAVRESTFQDDSFHYVIIATPNFTHFNLVKPALMAKKHVLCEKPLALDLTQVDELYSLAEHKECYLHVGFVLHRHPFYWLIKEWQKTHGEIVDIDVQNYATEGHNEPNWYWDKDKSGGWFMVAEIHWYHLFAWLTEPTSLEALQASEESKNGRTVATRSEIQNNFGATLRVEHRLDCDYKNAWAKIKITFKDGFSVLLSDWVAESLVCSTAVGEVSLPSPVSSVLSEKFVKREGNRFIDTRTRDKRYQDMIRQNVKDLLEGDYVDDHVIFLAHQVALAAQQLADK